MPTQIIRQGKTGRNERWILDMTDSHAVLTAPTGREVLRWTPVQVNQAVQFPSFSQSIKYTAFNVANVGTYQFSIDGATLKALRRFANRGIAAGGPKAIRSVLIKAILTSIGGLVLLVGGIVLACVTIKEVTTGESVTGGSHPAGFITAIVGLGVLCRGLYGFHQFSQLRKLVPPKG